MDINVNEKDVTLGVQNAVSQALKESVWYGEIIKALNRELKKRGVMISFHSNNDDSIIIYSDGKRPDYWKFATASEAIEHAFKLIDELAETVA